MQMFFSGQAGACIPSRPQGGPCGRDKMTGRMPIPLDMQDANSEPNALAWGLETFEAHHHVMIQRFVDS